MSSTHVVINTVHTLNAWLADVPDPGPGTMPPGFGKFATVLGWGKWVALGVVVAGFIAIGAQMAVQNRRGEGSNHLGALGYTAFGAIIIAGAFAMVGFLVGG